MEERTGAVEVTPALRASERGWWRRVAGLAAFARRKPLGAVSALIILGIIVVAVFAPLVDRYDPLIGRLPERLHGPSAAHWFGTDDTGRDVYSRVIHGARSALYIGFLSVMLGVAAGSLLGLVSGYLEGKTDLVIQRAVDSIQAFPALILALAVASVLGPSDNNSLMIIGLILVPGAARVVRGSTLSIKNNVYVDAAKAVGAGTPRIIFRHILPNVFAPIIVLASVYLGSAILVAASLSFLGAGKSEPDPAWGLMLSGQGKRYLELAPWVAVAPAIAISLTVLSFNLLGDAVRDVLDPRLRGR